MKTSHKTPSRKGYKHLNQFERDRIQSLLDQSIKPVQIGRILNRDKSSVGREIKRNKRSRGEILAPNAQAYEATTAQHKAYVRRHYAKYQGQKINDHKELKYYIIRRLKQHWNPDEIAGAMKLDRRPFYASKTTIYEWLYSASGQPYCQYLDSRQYQPAKRHAKAQKVMIPDRVSISERPLGANDRSQYGHLEADTMVSGKRTKSLAALVVVHERKARYIEARKIPNLKPDSFNEAVTAIQTRLVPMASLSLDNGIENRHHGRLGIPTFFCDPYSSWQKGGVENSNRMLRRYLPKGMDLALVSDDQLKRIVRIINNKPRKILGYKSALQVMREQGLLRQTATHLTKAKVALRG